MLAMLVYIWFRFEWQFGARRHHLDAARRDHDGRASIVWFRLEFNLTCIAAILTIVGYSINDTVVVYDRVRENLRKYKKMPIEQLLDLSMNQTLSRTILTGVTTLLALLRSICSAARSSAPSPFAMIFGILVGTYSSIFVAGPLLILFRLRPARRKRQGETPLPAGGAAVRRDGRMARRHRHPRGAFSGPRADRCLRQWRLPLRRTCRIAARSCACRRASMAGSRRIRDALTPADFERVFAAGRQDRDPARRHGQGTAAAAGRAAPGVPRGAGSPPIRCRPARRCAPTTCCWPRTAPSRPPLSPSTDVDASRSAGRSCGRPIATAISRRSMPRRPSAPRCLRSMPSTSRSPPSATASASRCPARSGCNGGATCSPRTSGECRRASGRDGAARGDPTQQAAADSPAELSRCPDLRSLRRSDADARRSRRLLRRDGCGDDPACGAGARPGGCRPDVRNWPGMPAARRRSPGCCGCCRCIARRGQCYVPKDILAAAGTTPRGVCDRRWRSKRAARVAAMIALGARTSPGLRARRRGDAGERARRRSCRLRRPPRRFRRWMAARARCSPQAWTSPAWRKHWLMFRRAARGWG